MGRGATKRLAFRRRRDVRSGAGIDQPHGAVHRELHAEGVGVAVPTGERPLRPGIDEELSPRGKRVHHRMDAARGESNGGRRSRRGGHGVEHVHRATSQKPQALLAKRDGGRLEVAAAVQDGPGRQRVGHALGPVAARIEDATAVVIAEARQRTRLREIAQRGQHPTDRVVERARDVDAVSLRQDPGVQEEVHGVHVIVDRLLEVHPVGEHLPLGGALHDAPSELAPSARRGQLRAQHADEEQRHALAQQMRVRREVGRPVPLQVAAVERQRAQEIRFEAGGKRERLAQQLPRPQPREAAEGDLQRARPVDPEGIGVLPLPVVPERDQLLREVLLLREPVGCGQRRHPLVSVQLPHDLVVADLGEVEEADPVPRRERRAPSVHGVEMPVDVLAVLDAFPPEQVESMLGDPPRALDDGARLLWEASAQRLEDLRHLAGREEEAARLDAHAAPSGSGEVGAEAAAHGVPPLCRLLRGARADFRPAHAGEPSERSRESHAPSQRVCR